MGIGIDDQHLQLVIDRHGLRHGEDEGGLAHAPLGIHYSDAVAHRVLQPPKAEATPAPRIDNGATKENLWRTAETCLDRRSTAHRPLGSAELASLRGDVAGICGRRDGSVLPTPRARIS